MVRSKYSLKEILVEEDLRQGDLVEKKVMDLGVPAAFSKSDWQRFLVHFTYNTNAIEGSSLSLEEVGHILQNRPINFMSDDVLETLGVANAMECYKDLMIDASASIAIHYKIFRKTKAFAGKIRKMGERVAVVGGDGSVYSRGAPPREIPKLMDELDKWYKDNRGTYSRITLASVVHNQLLHIHPFNDGNGRVSRVLLNSVLLQNDMAPVDIRVNHKDAYYAAMQEYQQNGNIFPTFAFLLTEYVAMRGLRPIERRKKSLKR